MNEPSEILNSYKISWLLPVYQIENSNLIIDAFLEKQLETIVGDLYSSPVFRIQSFQNSSPVSSESVLMISDSYGEHSAIIFASAFKSLMLVTANGLKDGKIVELIDKVLTLKHFDKIIFLHTEGNVARVIDFARTFAKLK